MNETLNCPQCGEPLEIPVQMLGQPVRCGACSNVFTPREPRFDRDEPPVVRSRRRRDPEAGRASRRVLLIVMLLFGLLLLGCCGGFSYFVYVMMHPTWQAYDSPTGEFTGKFPGDTQPGTRLTGRGGETATSITARRKVFQEEYFVYFISLPDSDQGKTPEALLNELADGLKNQNPGSTEFRNRVRRMHANCEAMDVCLEMIDDRFTTARIVLTKDKAYVVGVASPGEPDAKDWVEDYLDAFQPKEPAEKPANPVNPFRRK
jgi:hypothetical protein